MYKYIFFFVEMLRIWQKRSVFHVALSFQIIVQHKKCLLFLILLFLHTLEVPFWLNWTWKQYNSNAEFRYITTTKNSADVQKLGSLKYIILKNDSWRWRSWATVSRKRIEVSVSQNHKNVSWRKEKNLFPKKFPLEESNHFKLKSLLNQIESSNNMAAVHFLKFFMGSDKFGDQEAEKELGEEFQIEKDVDCGLNPTSGHWWLPPWYIGWRRARQLMNN